MPKRAGFLLGKIASIENLRNAIETFVKTRNNPRVRRRTAYLLEDEAQLKLAKTLQDQILSKQYRASPPRHFRHVDTLSKKERDICSFSIVDNIVQTAVVSVVEPILYRGAYFNSCCNIKGKGIARIKNYVQSFARKDDRKRRMAESKGKRYRSPVANYVKFDLRKFYDSIDHAHLHRLLCRRIKDMATVDLIMQFAEVNGVRGLCIGGRVSHVLANFYLEGFDRKILNSSACSRFARYMDDCVIWGPSKAKLHALVRDLSDGAHVFGLGVKPGWYVTPWRSRACDFCGYLFFSDGGIGVRKRIKLRIIRRLRGLAYGIKRRKLLDSTASYIGYLKHGDRAHLCKRYLGVDGIEGLKQFLRTQRKEQEHENRIRRKASGN